MDKIQSLKLDNGLEISVLEMPGSELMTVQCWVGVGSIYEDETERGMSHLLEHMLFKGTKKRNVGDVALHIEAAGGDVNAYTTFDRTVYYATVPAQNASVAIDVISDAVTSSSIDPGELARESEVVVEEIKRGLDSPGNMVGQKLFEHMFAGTEAGRPIIGSEESVRSFTREKVFGFYKHWYQPHNCRYVVAGKVNAEEVFNQLKSVYKNLTNSKIISHSQVIADRIGHPKVDLLAGDYKQERLELSFSAPLYLDTDAIYLDLAAYILGAGDAARLNQTIRDKEKLVSAIHASSYSPQFGGVFSINAFPVANKTQAVVKSVLRQLDLVVSKKPFTEEEIARAVANTKADYLHQQETVEGKARMLGFAMTTPWGEKYDTNYISIVERAKAADVNMAFRRWYDRTKLSLVAMLPHKSKIKASSFEKLLGISKNKQSSKLSSSNKVKTKKSTSQAPQRIKLSDGLELIYMQKLDTPFVNLTAVTSGGLRSESGATLGSQNAISGLLGRAGKKYPYSKMLDITESIGAGMDGFSGKDSIGLRMHCLKEHTALMLDCFADSWLRTSFPKDQWQSLKLELLEEIRGEDDSPARMCFRRLNELVYGEHSYAAPQYGSLENVKKFNEKSLLSEFSRIRDNGQWILSCISSLSLEEFLAIAQKNIVKFKPKKSKKLDLNSAKSLIPSPKFQNAEVQKDREQAHIAVGFRGLPWTAKQRLALDVYVNILSGQGGRLFLDLRDKQSLAYSVYAFSSFGVDGGVLGAYIACAKSKKDHALKELKDKMFGVLTNKPSQEEFLRARNQLIGSHASEMQRPSSVSMSMALMQLYGLGYDEPFSFEKRVSAVTLKDVLAIAEQLLDEKHMVQVTVG